MLKIILTLLFTLPFNIYANTKIYSLNIKIPHKPTLKLILANSEQNRRVGLMNIKKMDKNVGMMFVFDEENTHCFWMKNTYIPLSIAFVDSSKKIVDIQDMQPLDETEHCPPSNIKYAIEVNQGWFKNNNININQQLNF